MAPSTATLQEASWRDGESLLVLTVQDRIVADSRISVLIPSLFGLRFPSAGFRTDATFSVSIVAAWGHLKAIVYPLARVVSVPLDQSLANSTLQLLPPQTSPPPHVLWRVALQPVKGNGTLILRLPWQCKSCPSAYGAVAAAQATDGANVTAIVSFDDYYGGAGAGQGPSGSFFRKPPEYVQCRGYTDATQTAANVTLLRIDLQSRLSSMSVPVVLSLKIFSGAVHVDPRGIRVGSEEHFTWQLFASTSHGTPATAITSPSVLGHVQPVGAVLQSRLKFSPHGVGMKTEVTLSFSLSMTVEEGETLSLALPGFFMSPGSTGIIELSANSSNYTATYDDVSSTLHLTARSTLEPSHSHLVVIARAQGLSLPHLGISPQDAHAFKMRAAARDGVVAPCTLDHVDLVSTFLKSALGFSNNSVAGFASGVFLNVSLSRPILEGDTISVFMPGFSLGNARNAMNASKFSWTPPPPSATSGAGAACYDTNVNASGSCNQSLALTNCDEGEGSCHTSQASFDEVPMHTGFVGDIQTVPSVLLQLSQGTVTRVAYVHYTPLSTFLGSALTTPASGLMISIQTNPAQPHVPLALCIPTCAGVVLPQTGVHKDAMSGIMIRLTSRHGYISWQRMQQVQPVGACQASILWDNPLAGAISAVQISLSCAASLLPGDTVVLDMKGFEVLSLEDAIVNATSSAVAALADVDVLLSLPVLSSYYNTTSKLDSNSTSSNSSGGRSSVLVWWRYKKGTLDALQPSSNFLVLQAITHGTHTIDLSADLGIRLPAQGLQPGAISLSSDSPSGPIAPTYGWSAGLGEFYVNYLTFAPPQAGTQSGIVVLVCLSQQMRAQEELILVLPGFGLNASMHPSPGATAVESCLFGEPISLEEGSSSSSGNAGGSGSTPAELAVAGFVREKMGFDNVTALYEALQHVVSFEWRNAQSLQALGDIVKPPSTNTFVASATNPDGHVHVHLRSLKTVRARQVLALVVPSALGVVLPQDGYTPGHNFSIRSRVEAALTVPKSVFSASVGHFRQTFVRYKPAGRDKLLEGELAVITIAFALNAQIRAGEIVRVYLPSFQQVTGHTCSRDGTTLNDLRLALNISNVTWPDVEGPEFQTINTVFHKFLFASWNPAQSRLRCVWGGDGRDIQSVHTHALYACAHTCSNPLSLSLSLSLSLCLSLCVHECLHSPVL